MKVSSGLRAGWVWTVMAGTLTLGCGGGAPAATQPTQVSKPAAAPPPVAAVTAAPTWPALRTGNLQPTEGDALDAKITGYVRKPETETFRLELPPSALCDQGTPAFELVRVPGEWGVGVVTRSDSCTLWLRRKVVGERASQPLRVEVLSITHEAYARGDAGTRSFVTAVPPIKLNSDDKLVGAFYSAMLEAAKGGPLGGVLASAVKGRPAPKANSAAEWVDLGNMVSGYDSIEASLHEGTTLSAAAELGRAKLPIQSLKLPASTPLPWATMLSKLDAESRVQLGSREPLARVTPRDFYWIRAESFAALHSVGKEVDQWVSPALRLSSVEHNDHDLLNRYRAQLGLSESVWTERLGPKLIRALAVVGSDPFLRAGSDVSVLIRPIEPRALVNALNAKAGLEGGALGEVAHSETEYRGVSIVERRDKTETVLRQLSVHLPDVPGVGPLTIISNSRGALHRILDVVLDQQASLADEPDFQYMLARDAKTEAPLLAFAGERFIEHAVSPVPRILDSRRQLARTELTRVSSAALVFGWLEGREPRDMKELLTSPWLTQKHLKHWNGDAIQAEVGSAPQSSFGTPAFLTPIIDLPAPKFVTEAEHAAYAEFAEAYSQQWRRVVDPIALRLGLNEAGQIASFHLRVLPLLLSSDDYSEILQFAGDMRVSGTPAVPGAEVAVGIAPRSPLREQLSGEAVQFLGNKFALDWLGDWVAVGIADDVRWIQLLRASGLSPEVTGREESGDVLHELGVNPPAYLAVDIKRRAGAAVVLTLLRKNALEAMGDGIQWGEHSKVNGVSVIRVRLDEYELFYALTEHRLFIAGKLELLSALIAGDATRKIAAGITEQSGGQLTAGFQREGASPLLTAGAWLLERGLREDRMASAPAAAALFAGAHGRDPQNLRALGLAYLGYVPVNAEGQMLTWTDTGVTDPDRGSAFAPRYPALPIARSLVANLVSALRRLQFELAFDEEPGAAGLRSLRSRVTLDRKP
jgi:hypothetical protein